ncbi:hypothetical protein BKA82DRAFT_4111509 [Pisolithus tinctorius]|nr:hypothetical protein BKA82DRAFT_4111509 [Pisolithus tinctorius]
MAMVSVSVGAPPNVVLWPSLGQCVRVYWRTGGQSPFWIFIFPVDHSTVWYPVPSSAYSGNQGNYPIPQLSLPQGQQFVLSMYDEAGFVMGGTTDLLQVAGPASGSSCNTTSSQTFSFAYSSRSFLGGSPSCFDRM